jgi:ATP-dependent helicase HrpB
MTRTHAPLPRLPVSEVLPDIAAGLACANRAVLSAPPGAGKTTLVPLFLLGQDWCSGVSSVGNSWPDCRLSHAPR